MLYSFAVWATALATLASAQTASPLDPITLSAPGINATFIAYGARLTSLFVNDKNGDPQDIALGYVELREHARSYCHYQKKI